MIHSRSIGQILVICSQATTRSQYAVSHLQALHIFALAGEYLKYLLAHDYYQRVSLAISGIVSLPIVVYAIYLSPLGIVCHAEIITDFAAVD